MSCFCRPPNLIGPYGLRGYDKVILKRNYDLCSIYKMNLPITLIVQIQKFYALSKPTQMYFQAATEEHIEKNSICCHKKKLS